MSREVTCTHVHVYTTHDGVPVALWFKSLPIKTTEGVGFESQPVHHFSGFTLCSLCCRSTSLAVNLPWSCHVAYITLVNLPPRQLCTPASYIHTYQGPTPSLQLLYISPLKFHLKVCTLNAPPHHPPLAHSQQWWIQDALFTMTVCSAWWISSYNSRCIYVHCT